MSKTEFDLDKLAIIDDYTRNHEEKYRAVVPTREGLAVLFGVTLKTIKLWEQEEFDVRYRLEKMDAVYRNDLIQKGLRKETNATITTRLMEKAGIIDSPTRRGKKDNENQNNNVPENYDDIPPITKGMSEEEAARINERRRTRDRAIHQQRQLRQR